MKHSSITRVTILKNSLRDVPWAQKYDSIYYVEFDCGIEGVFRPYSQTQNSKYFDTTVFAYLLSRDLSFNVVPPAVERSIKVAEINPDLEVLGSLQLFINPTTWSVEAQKYSDYDSLVSEVEKNNVETFQFITGLCDRHKGNRIIDDYGNVALVDVGDICNPKMIIPGHWEYVLIGSLEPEPNINGKPNFENQPVFKVVCPTDKDLHTIMKPFVSNKRLDYYVKMWRKKLGLKGQKTEQLEYVIWRNCLWIKHSRQTYSPIQNVTPSGRVLRGLRKVKFETLMRLSANDNFKLTSKTIFYRIQRILDCDTNASIALPQRINFPMRDIFRSLALHKEAHKLHLFNASRANDLYKSRQIKASLELADMRKKYFEAQSTIKNLDQKLSNVSESLISQKNKIESISTGFREAQETIRRLVDAQEQKSEIE